MRRRLRDAMCAMRAVAAAVAVVAAATAESVAAVAVVVVAAAVTVAAPCVAGTVVLKKIKISRIYIIPTIINNGRRTSFKLRGREAQKSHPRCQKVSE